MDIVINQAQILEEDKPRAAERSGATFSSATSSNNTETEKKNNEA